MELTDPRDVVELVEAERSRILAAVRKLGRPLKGSAPRRRYDPNSAAARSLRESGQFSEQTIEILSEAHEIEVTAAREWGTPAKFRREIPARVSAALQVFQETCEACGDGQDGTGQLLMPETATGWKSEGDTKAVYAHAQHGRLHLHANGRFSHHAPGSGRIVGSGTGQDALDTYLRKLKAAGDAGGNPAANGAADANAEALDAVLGRIRNGGESGPTAALTMAEAKLQPKTEAHGSAAAHRLVAARLQGDRAPAAAHQLIESLRKARSVEAPSGDLHARLRAAVVTK